MTLLDFETVKNDNRTSDITLNKYECNWCKHHFEREVGKLHTASEKGRGVVSDEVRCPKCNNAIKTWV